MWKESLLFLQWRRQNKSLLLGFYILALCSLCSLSTVSTENFLISLIMLFPMIVDSSMICGLLALLEHLFYVWEFPTLWVLLAQVEARNSLFQLPLQPWCWHVTWSLPIRRMCARLWFERQQDEKESAVWNSVLSRVTEMAFLKGLEEVVSMSSQGHWCGS